VRVVPVLEPGAHSAMPRMWSHSDEAPVAEGVARDGRRAPDHGDSQEARDLAPAVESVGGHAQNPSVAYRFDNIR